MIRKAKVEDINAILKIVKKAVAIMQYSGNDQWNSGYPSYDDFLRDIASGTLFVDSEIDGKIKSFVCLNMIQPEEYINVEWRFDKPALVIHRMAVDPEYHGSGLARKLFDFAENRASELKLGYIRSDTCSLNAGMNSLFKKLGYNFSGTINFPGFKYDFNCFEKATFKEE